MRTGCEQTSQPTVGQRGAYVQAGHRLVRGVEPRVGERVWLTVDACYQVHSSGWFLVERVEAAYAPECCYLHGVHLGRTVSDRQRLYVAVPRLQVERCQAEGATGHPGSG